jgi:hypothetical protein
MLLEHMEMVMVMCILMEQEEQHKPLLPGI